MRHRIGFIADVQYADIDDVWNFMRTHKRKYRATLNALRNGVDWWQETDGLDFVADLGDAIDGFRNSDRAMGMHAIRAVMGEWNRFALARPDVPVVHLNGNHELYKFTREELTNGVESTGFSCSCPSNASNVCDKPKSIYFSLKLRPGSPWRIVVLDPYDESVMTNGGGRVGHELTLENGGLHAAHTAKCQSNNPNDILKAVNYFAGLEGVESRWCPFNGGVGPDQLIWLEDVFKNACIAKEKVILLSHVILHPEATPRGNCHTLLWNYDKVLNLIERYDCVKLALYGHAHQDGYFWCPQTGVHHITVPSPLEAHDEDVEQTFGILEISDDDATATIIGRGAVKSRTLELR